MIYDCFTYFNEEDLLHLRLLELKDVVDYFVIVEAGETFTGHRKELNIGKLDWLYSEWSDRVLYFPIGGFHPEQTSWEREWSQRNWLWESCGPLINDNDIILFSDVDEIPNPDVIKALSKSDFDPCQLDVTQFFWNFNWQVPDHCNQGARPVIARAKDVTTPQEMRASSDMERIYRGGWHFSFLGHHMHGFKEKVEAFSHTEVNLDKYKDQELIKARARMGIDPFDRFPLKYMALGENHPKALKENLDLFGKYVMDGIDI